MALVHVDDLAFRIHVNHFVLVEDRLEEGSLPRAERQMRLSTVKLGGKKASQFGDVVHLDKLLVEALRVFLPLLEPEMAHVRCNELHLQVVRFDKVPQYRHCVLLVDSEVRVLLLQPVGEEATHDHNVSVGWLSIWGGLMVPVQAPLELLLEAVAVEHVPQPVLLHVLESGRVTVKVVIIEVDVDSLILLRDVVVRLLLDLKLALRCVK